MSEKDIITVSGLSKRYQLGSLSARTLREEADQLFKRLRYGKAKDGDGTAVGVNGNSLSAETGKADPKEFWALRNVSFSIRRGEIVGIIGRNGAGKSTLLKILSRITEPTEGEAVLRGRVASLLEVGTGFHPELSGRENIYLNGAILGMKRAEMDRKFSEIVAFSEVEQFIDTPVKRYSSGMYVRLAFAIAAHLDPDILVIDEVLAVGDMQFQKKCLGKMEDVAQSGRTVLFVSHNMGVVANLCTKCILLENGSVLKQGPTAEVLRTYVQTGAQHAGEVAWERNDKRAVNSRFHLRTARILSAGETTSEVEIDKEVILQFDFEVQSEGLNVSSSIHLFDKQSVWVLCSGTATKRLAKGLFQHEYHFPRNFFNDGLYTIGIFLITNVTNIELNVKEAISFCVHETGAGREEYGGAIGGCIRPILKTEEREISAI